jgi:hypothetical protein
MFGKGGKGGGYGGGTGGKGGPGGPGGEGGEGGGGFDGRRSRSHPNFERPTVDYNSCLIRHIQSRVFQTEDQDYLPTQPDDEYSPGPLA